MSRLNEMQTALRRQERPTPPTEVVTGPLRRALRARRTVRELERLNDRELRDIGVERGDIPALAARLAAAEAPVPAHRRSLIAALRRGWARRAMIRDLQRLPDHVLQDVGIPRYEIEPMVERALDRLEGRQPAPPSEFWELVEGAVRRARQWQWTRTPAGRATRAEDTPEAPAQTGTRAARAA